MNSRIDLSRNTFIWLSSINPIFSRYKFGSLSHTPWNNCKEYGTRIIGKETRLQRILINNLNQDSSITIRIATSLWTLMPICFAFICLVCPSACHNYRPEDSLPCTYHHAQSENFALILANSSQKCVCYFRSFGFLFTCVDAKKCCFKRTAWWKITFDRWL